MGEEDKGFVIKDRRRFSEDAPASEEAAPRTDPEPEAETRKARTDAEPKAGERQPPLPEVNFSTFVFSLATSALLHLGDLADPMTGQTSVNLPLAKQTIDILGMLEAKTRGNLDDEETNLLSNLLYELRMKFVAAGKK
ncbi:MAG: DUF1844 domain-containing protein [Proteobacteria bacterium]|nr:DUF1844 domain-containing protein [Pseudomonadota bacterium]